MTNEELIHDFILQVGFFSEESISNFVNPQHLREVKFHHSAGARALELAKQEQCKTEWARLMRLVEWHFSRTDELLKRYNV